MAFAYFSNSPVLDSFLSPEMRQDREYKRTIKIFPEQLGEYVLYERGPKKISISNECRKIENHPDVEVAGLTGEFCQKLIIGQYRQITDGKVVFIHLSQINKGKDAFQALLKKLSQPDKLGKYNIVRFEQHELGWYPASKLDVILTQEGMAKVEIDGSESMSYKEKASGNNPVTKYFINQYPPALAD